MVSTSQTGVGLVVLVGTTEGEGVAEGVFVEVEIAKGVLVSSTVGEVCCVISEGGVDVISVARTLAHPHNKHTIKLKAHNLFFICLFFDNA